MDGFDPNTAVVVLAATNREICWIQRLMRPGRFDPESDMGNARS